MFLDDRGRVADIQELLFTDEAEAIHQVGRRRHEVAVELWEANRFIRRFEPSRSPPELHFEAPQD